MASKCKTIIEFLVSIASILTAIVALLALYTAKNELLSNRESAAYELYNSYLEMAYEKPAFAEPQFEYIKNSSEFTAYTWFVSRMLFSAEQIMSLDLSKEAMYEWEKTLCIQVRYHKAYLKEKSFEETKGIYNFNIQRMIEHVIKNDNACDFKIGYL
ncbi:hypothetical protein [Aeromonas hydrophila]|uniref:hypothetical protein n=1 Tax=Aeromonas hydrophila TaxID=644 RepID=UPI00044F0DDA|nr:hypothetical protein [Aeromonas hydrophila]EZH85138.1 hypothetical protein AT59_07365 [Aeromonas hydrophila AD9]